MTVDVNLIVARASQRPSRRLARGPGQVRRLGRDRGTTAQAGGARGATGSGRTEILEGLEEGASVVESPGPELKEGHRAHIRKPGEGEKKAAGENKAPGEKKQ
jgi:hypothetical protein